MAAVSRPRLIEAEGLSGHRMYSVEDQRAWDGLITGSGAPTVLQRWAWGEYKRSLGFTVRRILSQCGNEWWAAQGWTRWRLPAYWAPEGPVRVSSGAAEAAGRSLISFPIGVIGSPFPTNTWGTTADGVLVRGQLFHPEEVFTDLTSSDEELMRRLHQKWRNHLRRSLESGLVVSEVDEATAINFHEQTIRELEARKGFSSPWSRKALQSLFSSGMSVMCLAGCQRGKPVAIKIVAVDPPAALTIASAVSEEGRAKGAGYALHWHTYSALRERGVTSYNLGGCDSKKNGGVALFKTGAAATTLVTPGSFVFCNSRTIGAAIARVVGRLHGSAAV